MNEDLIFYPCISKMFHNIHLLQYLDSIFLPYIRCFQKMVCDVIQVNQQHIPLQALARDSS